MESLEPFARIAGITVLAIGMLSLVWSISMRRQIGGSIAICFAAIAIFAFPAITNVTGNVAKSLVEGESPKSQTNEGKVNNDKSVEKPVKEETEPNGKINLD